MSATSVKRAETAARLVEEAAVREAVTIIRRLVDTSRTRVLPQTWAMTYTDGLDPERQKAASIMAAAFELGDITRTHGADVVLPRRSS